MMEEEEVVTKKKREHNLSQSQINFPSPFQTKHLRLNILSR